MELCLVKVFLPLQEESNIRHLLSADDCLDISISPSSQQLSVEITLEKKRVDSLVRTLKREFNLEDDRLLILPADTLKSAITTSQPSASEGKQSEREQTTLRDRRQEIYAQMSQSISLDSTEISLVVLATAIAAIGLLQNSQVVIIGAMVIAPLLKPNMALAVATTFGDLSLAIRTIKVGLTEIAISLLLSILLGFLVPIDLSMNEIAIRTKVELSDVVLAFASGTAGAISLTVGEQKAVVGVMVSVALLPPLVVLGMLIGSGVWSSVIETAVLVSTNIVCLNLAAIATFWLRDVKPQAWWEKFQASKITGLATTFWLIILVLLICFIFMFQFDEAKASLLF